MNGSAEAESLFRRSRQPINANRSSENLKTSVARFAASKQSFDRRQLGKTAHFGQGEISRSSG